MAQAIADPSRIVAESDDLLAAAIDPDDRVATYRAIGLALRELGRLDEAEQALTAGIDVVEGAGPAVRVSCQLTLGSVLLMQGKAERGIGLIRSCVDGSRGLQRAEANMQLGTAYARIGDLDRTLEHYGKALPVIRRHGRTDWEADLLLNRGTVHLLRGRYARALQDLDAAVATHRELGNLYPAAFALRNRAEIRFMIGDLAGALDEYRSANDALDALGVPGAQRLQQCDLLLATGHFEEVFELARSAFPVHRQQGNTFEQMFALALGAQAALALDRSDLVIQMAAHLVNVEGAENFPTYLSRVMAANVHARAELAETEEAGEVADALMAELRAVRRRPMPEIEQLTISLALSEADLVAGRHDRAHTTLIESRRLADRAPLTLQVEYWTMLAKIRALTGADRGVASAIRTARERYEQLMASTGSYATRVLARRHADELLDLGVEKFVARGNIAAAIELTDAIRAAPFLSRVPSAPQGLLADLQKARSSAEGGEAAGHEVLRLEREVAARQSSSRSPTPRGRDIDAVFVTFVESGGAVWRLVDDALDGSGLARVGAAAELRTLVAAQATAARVLSRRRRLSARAVARADVDYDDVSAGLRALLFGGLHTDRAVLNPCDALRGTVWGSVAPAEFVISPSRALAQRAALTAPTSMISLGGSNLAHAAAEVRAVAETHDGTWTIDPDASHVAALAGVDGVHLAGHFLSDSHDPLFSAIELGGFLLHAHELAAAAPKLVVLSACTSDGSDVANSTIRSFGAALLAAGTATVIATSAPIEDSEGTVAFASVFHRHLASGEGPAASLTSARAAFASDPTVKVLANSFVALGSGWP